VLQLTSNIASYKSSFQLMSEVAINMSPEQILH